MFMKPEELKKLVMEYIRKESPEFADSEPIITDEIQSVKSRCSEEAGYKDLEGGASNIQDIHIPKDGDSRGRSQDPNSQ